MEQSKAFLSRRKLIVALGGAVVAGAALIAAPIRSIIQVASRQLVRPAAAALRLGSLADANYDEWFDQVGTTFLVGGGSGLKLISATAMPAAGRRPPRLSRDQAFLLKFDVQNRGTMAGDLIYTIVHARRGAFQIFLSASTDPALPHRMTALFN